MVYHTNGAKRAQRHRTLLLMHSQMHPARQSLLGRQNHWKHLRRTERGKNKLNLPKKLINSLGTKNKNSDNDPEYYRSPEYRQLLHRLANVVFSPRRNEWKSKEELAKFAYKLCMDGHPF